MFTDDMVCSLGFRDKTQSRGDFPGGPVIKTSPSDVAGAGSTPDRGPKIPHASCQKTETEKQRVLQ